MHFKSGSDYESIALRKPRVRNLRGISSRLIFAMSDSKMMFLLSQTERTIKSSSTTLKY